LTVHEYNVPLNFSPKRIIARVILDVLFLVIALVSQRVIVTHGWNYRKLQKFLFWKKQQLTRIPVGSNIPLIHQIDKKNPPRCVNGELVFILFGQPKAMEEGLLKELGRLFEDQRDKIVIRWIARSRKEILEVWKKQCKLDEGMLEIYEGETAKTVSRLLQEGDVFLAPFRDGVSSRRTTVMAALEHSLPIVGTRGICTDSLFCDGKSFLLNEPGLTQTFRENLEFLLGTQRQMDSMRNSAQEMYTNNFSWRVIARRYQDLINQA
jgi:glycosyltransferase involved in cell wall biosynthesis